MLLEAEELPAHIEQSVQAMAALHLEHQRSASPIHRFADRTVRFASRPRFAGLLLLLISAWIAGNTFALRSTGHAIDAPPFQWLQDGMGALALFLTVLILITQRREYQLDERRARLTLHLALVADHKNAKLISMMETLLRNQSNTRADHDPEVSEMAIPANSAAILSAIDRTHEDEL